MKLAFCHFHVLSFQEGTALLEGEKLGETRQDTKSKKGRPAGPQRSRTIQKTMEEGRVWKLPVSVNCSQTLIWFLIAKMFSIKKKDFYQYSI